MKRSSRRYNEAQYKLVVNCEKQHRSGFRHTSLSGEITNRLLVQFLKREFPSLNFRSGIVWTAPAKSSKPSTKELGPQTDIIVYSGRAYRSIFDYAVVPRRCVLLVIEVKKWVNPKSVARKNKGINRQIKKLKSFIKKPVVLVAFRHHGDKQLFCKKCVAGRTFLFSRASGGKYPHAIAGFQQSHIHSGELFKLCKEIRRYST